MYINTPLNYTGSKFKLLEQIIPEFDYKKPHFVDLFTGGGSIYTNIVDKYNEITINDIITDIIGIHKCLIESDSIIKLTKELCPDKSNPVDFSILRSDYNNNPSPEKLWALMLSSTNNMMRYNKKFQYNQTFGRRGWNDNIQKKVDNFTKHIRKYKDKIRFSSTHFENIEVQSNMMIYCDPPYGRIKEEDGSLGKKQISEAGYNAFWLKEDDIKLYNFLINADKVGASFMVSGVLYHDGKTCWMLDKLIADGFKYKVIEYDYNKVSRKGDKETREIIITNYEK